MKQSGDVSSGSETRTHDVAILGAGFGGLGMAAQLKQAGIEDFIVLERNEGVGGVWKNNDYPGAACDTESHIYNYSYFPHLDVSRAYAGRDELLGYMEGIVEHFDFAHRLRLRTEVVNARWEANEAHWRITAADGQVFHARFLVPAWGQLNLPSVPNLSGLSDFAGSSFHSARWDHSLDLTGKRILSIGTAASAVQYVPEIAKIASHVVVFQRSANWMLPRKQEIYSDDQLNTFKADPRLFEASRQAIHEAREQGFERTRPGSEAQREAVQQALDHLAAQVPDLELRRQLTPNYEFGCKRILKSDDYYPALMRANVSLVSDPPARVTPTGIEMQDGTLYEGDVIIFGTGFKSQAFNGGLRILGLKGLDLADRWGESPEAFLGMTVDGFPNMFMIYGPNTNLNHNSIIPMLEIQQKYIVDVLRDVLPENGSWVDVDPGAVAHFNLVLQAKLDDSTFASDCSSWYKNAAGRIINNWSGTVEEYKRVAVWNRAKFLSGTAGEPQSGLVEVGTHSGGSPRISEIERFLASVMYGE